VRTLWLKQQMFWERYTEFHLPYMQHADIAWSDYDRSATAIYEGVGDSACWTGHFLATVAIRHSIRPSPKLRDTLHQLLDVIDMLTLVSGRDGYIARFAAPASDAAYRAYYQVYGKGEDPERPGLGKRAFAGVAPWEDHVWLGWSSRDTYDGVQLGLAAAWANCREEGLRVKVRTIVERVGDRLIADEFHIKDGKGNTTTPTGMFRAAWMRLMMSVNPEKYASLHSEYRDIFDAMQQFPLRLRDQWNREYFPNNLTFSLLYTLCILEDTPAMKASWQGLVRQAWQEQLHDHLNAHFAALYLLLTGDDNSTAQATLQGMLLDFPMDKWARAVDRRGEVEMRSEDLAAHALLAHEQVPTDFMWQRAPTITHGSFNLPIEYPALDYLIPYWLGRKAGAIPAP
jgi:hypothetical protein